MNLDYTIRLVFTHPENRRKSINSIARKLDVNPGSLYRILQRLSPLLPPKPRYCPEIPTSPFDPAKQAVPRAPTPSNGRRTATKN
jgi:transposase-like protein